MRWYRNLGKTGSAVESIKSIYSLLNDPLDLSSLQQLVKTLHKQIPSLYICIYTETKNRPNTSDQPSSYLWIILYLCQHAYARQSEKQCSTYRFPCPHAYPLKNTTSPGYESPRGWNDAASNRTSELKVWKCVGKAKDWLKKRLISHKLDYHWDGIKYSTCKRNKRNIYIYNT